MKKEELYNWMDNQIIASKLQNIVVDPENSFYIKNAGVSPNEVHVYGIDNLCKELDIPYEEEPHDDAYDKHYFMYKEYKFFGLVDKERNDEGQ